MQNKESKLPFLTFFISSMLIAFAIGVWITEFKKYPYPLISTSYKQLAALLGKPHHMNNIRYDFTGVQVHDRDKVAPGYTFVTSYWENKDWQPGAALIDADGNIVHQWVVNPKKIWPNSPHTDWKAGSANHPTNYIHGSYLLPNGDIIVAIEYLGLVRMNSCGEVVWKLPIRAHHSVSRTEDGNFWVSSMKWIEKSPEGNERLKMFPGLKAPVVEDYVVKVSPDGEILEEISLLELLYKENQQRLFWKIAKLRSDDIGHLNKVEELSPTLSSAYPNFQAGDLIISQRHTHAVYVFDPDSMEIKWIATDPFMEQHDPQFKGDGWIAIFNNNHDSSGNGRFLGGSNIVEINPTTGETRVAYPNPETSEQPFRFYTQTGGKFQMLENGNLLITEARAGHVFEVDTSGKLVWQWVQTPYDDESVPEVLEGRRYELLPETIKNWKCQGLN